MSVRARHIREKAGAGNKRNRTHVDIPVAVGAKQWKREKEHRGSKTQFSYSVSYTHGYARKGQVPGIRPPYTIPYMLGVARVQFIRNRKDTLRGYEKESLLENPSCAVSPPIRLPNSHQTIRNPHQYSNGSSLTSPL